MNNKLLKTLALGMSAVLCVAALSACGSNNDYNYTLSEYITVAPYKGMTLSASAVEAQVTAQLESLQTENSETVDITDRAVALGDTVNIDYAGTIDGEAFTGGTAAAQTITLGDGGMIDGFEDGIVGMTIGENKTIDVTFPEDYGNTEVAGKDAQFAITLNSATESIIPELNDEFIAGLDNGYTTLDSYTEYLTENIRKSLLWNNLVAASVVTTYPKDETKNYYDQMVATYEQMAAYYGVPFSTYISSYMGTDVETFFAQVSDQSKSYVKNDLVLYTIVRAENISISDADYQKYGAIYATNYGFETLDDYEAQYGKDEVERNVLTEVVGDWLVANAVAAE